MKTTYKDHSKILSLVKYFCYIDLDVFYEKIVNDEKTIEVSYFELIKENKLINAYQIVNFFFSTYFKHINFGEIDSNFNAKHYIRLINFVEEEFGAYHDFYQKNIINGSICIGNNNIPQLDESLLNFETQPFIKLEPVFDFAESDFETAIEIVTDYFYTIPVVKINLCSDNIFFISHSREDDLSYSESTKKYYGIPGKDYF